MNFQNNFYKKKSSTINNQFIECYPFPKNKKPRQQLSQQGFF